MRFTTATRGLLFSLLALGQPLVWAQDAKPAAAAPAASAPADAVTPAFAPALMAAQNALNAGQSAEALAKLREAAALPNPSVFEQYLISRMQAAALLKTGDLGGAIPALTATLASPKLPAADRVLMLQALVDAQYRHKDYAGAAKSAQRYFDAGGNLSEIRLMQGQSAYLTDDFPQALKQVRQYVAEQDVAGKLPAEGAFKVWAASAHKANDTAAYEAALMRLIAHYPKAEYWADAMARAERVSGFGEKNYLEAYRLRQALGLLESAADYQDFGDLSLRAGFPNEATAILAQGYAKGLLGKGAEASRQAQLRDSAAKRGADDKRDLAQADAAIGRARDGDALVRLGYALVTAGQVDKGLQTMAQGVARSDVKQPDEARLLLGTAQYNAGKKAEALATFKAVPGSNPALAGITRLWVALASQR